MNSLQAIEHKASQLLGNLNLRPRIPVQLTPKCVEVDVKEVARRLNVKLLEYDFGDEISGVLLFDKDEVVIGVSRSNGVNRQRFTIAHELGHFVLGHPNKGVFVDTPDKYFPPLFRNQLSSSGELPNEREANAFAASLLMPDDLVREVIERIKLHKFHLLENYDLVDQLAKFFSVSPQAMLFRLNRLSIWDENTQRIGSNW